LTEQYVDSVLWYTTVCIWCADEQ